MTRNINGCGSAELYRHPHTSKVHCVRYIPRLVPWNLLVVLAMLCVLGRSQAMPPGAEPNVSVLPTPQSQTAPAQAQTPKETQPAVQPQAGSSPASTPVTTGSPDKPNAQGQVQGTTPGVAQPANTPATAPKVGTDAASPFEEVHINPRKEPEKPVTGRATNVPSPAELDPSLKTHTKPMKVDVDLVLVPVTVTDPMNRLVTGLEKDNFVVMDGGEKQEVRHFSAEDAPISLGVVFDISGSMKDKIDKAREAVVEFFKTANPEDEFFMIAFSDKPTLLSDFTQSVEEIQGRMLYANPQGRTALLDAIYLGLSKMKDAKHQKKALLIISDGGDNHSRYTESEIKTIVREADVQTYAIGIFSAGASTPEEISGPTTLAEITDVTGGRTFTVNNPNELADVATKIGIELRNQYVLGYRPNKPARDGKWRKIKVKLAPPKGLPPLTVYAKTGYYAPTE